MAQLVVWLRSSARIAIGPSDLRPEWLPAPPAGFAYPYAVGVNTLALAPIATAKAGRASIAACQRVSSEPAGRSIGNSRQRFTIEPSAMSAMVKRSSANQSRPARWPSSILSWARRSQAAVEHHNSYLKGTSISVASCSFDNGVAMYLKLTASAIARSRPSIRPGKTLFFG